MTIIEFYDTIALENIAGTLLCEPDQMILLGGDRKQLEQVVALYQSILAKNGIQTQISPKSVNKNNLQELVDSLAQIVESHNDCVFDLTGGEDLYLVAVGIIMNRYKERVQCHRFNFRNGTLHDCDADGRICRSKSFDLSIENHISIYGGNIVSDPQEELFTYPWEFVEEFERDIDTMWSICRKDPKRWNAQATTLGIIGRYFEMPDELSVSVDKEIATSVLAEKGFQFAFDSNLLHELQRNGLIHSLVMQNTVSFCFKNEQVKQTLTVAGQILELTVAKAMRACKDKDGSPLYHDVKVGVVIAWDRLGEKTDHPSINEIDVIAMKGCVPVFISCKNGNFDTNELYKLNTVAEHFGSKYAKKALISTELDKLGERAEYLRARMDDLNIHNIENVDEMPHADFEKVLKSLWRS